MNPAVSILPDSFYTVFETQRLKEQIIKSHIAGQDLPVILPAMADGQSVTGGTERL